MGLSISYQIVTERHGGSITCQSAIGEGTTFTIHIPQRQAEQTALLATAEKPVYQYPY